VSSKDPCRAPHARDAPRRCVANRAPDANGYVVCEKLGLADPFIDNGTSVILLERMKIPTARVVRIMGLGEDGCKVVPSVARAVSDLWSGDALVQIESACTGDDKRLAVRSIRRWCDRDHVDVVFTVGRSGHERADFAPEMTALLLERALPGVEERMYLAPPRGRSDLLFRGRAGMRGCTLVVNLPARLSRARVIVRFLGPVVGHAIEKARGSDRDCVQAGALP